MTRFGFIGHFLSMEHLAEVLGPLGRHLRGAILATKSFIPHLPPFKYVKIGPICSRAGNETVGFGILCPLLPEHFATLEKRFVQRKVLSAIRLGERLGVSIVGLGGFTSICCDEGAAFVGQVNAMVTSGNTYTAALAVQGVLEAAVRTELPLEQATLAVIGATGDIGSGVTRALASRVRRVIIAARNDQRLREFSDELARYGARSTTIVKHVREAVSQAEVIVSATSAVTTVVEPSDLQPGTILCDIAIPHSISREVRRLRDDILVFDGGMAKFPPLELMKRNQRWSNLFPQTTEVYGCLAETVILALDGHVGNFSVGRGYITPEKIATITTMAEKHAFSLGELRCGGAPYSLDEIAKIREHVRKRFQRLVHV